MLNRTQPGSVEQCHAFCMMVHRKQSLLYQFEFAKFDQFDQHTTVAALSRSGSRNPSTSHKLHITFTYQQSRFCCQWARAIAQSSRRRKRDRFLSISGSIEVAIWNPRRVSESDSGLVQLTVDYLS